MGLKPTRLCENSKAFERAAGAKPRDGALLPMLRTLVAEGGRARHGVDIHGLWCQLLNPLRGGPSHCARESLSPSLLLDGNDHFEG